MSKRAGGRSCASDREQERTAREKGPGRAYRKTSSREGRSSDFPVGPLSRFFGKRAGYAGWRDDSGGAASGIIRSTVLSARTSFSVGSSEARSAGYEQVYVQGELRERSKD